MSYRPYVTPKGGHVVYVLTTADRGREEIKGRLDSGEIPLARLATERELQMLEGINIPTLPEELTDIVRSALVPNA